MDLIKLLKQEQHNPNLSGSILDRLTDVDPNPNLPGLILDHLKDFDLTDNSYLIKYFKNLKDEQENNVIKSDEVRKFCKNLKKYLKSHNVTNLENLCDCITEEKPPAHSVTKPKLMEPTLQNKQGL